MKIFLIFFTKSKMLYIKILLEKLRSLIILTFIRITKLLQIFQQEIKIQYSKIIKINYLTSKPRFNPALNSLYSLVYLSVL